MNKPSTNVYQARWALNNDIHETEYTPPRHLCQLAHIPHEYPYSV